ncbi:uncharacterized protein VTP21DRAFT_9182 [Calcarisporiella thermophila]|uniref:uncharacterized protein n=1 Tax=Calcarisporiella thermophila TaxID=911321 RepID=UPI0037443BA0
MSSEDGATILQMSLNGHMKEDGEKPSQPDVNSSNDRSKASSERPIPLTSQTTNQLSAAAQHLLASNPEATQQFLASNPELAAQLQQAGLNKQESPLRVVQNARQANPQQQKPPVGSEEWHRLRKENHKEVERRRRETINEGINELAKIVPGCEKNKGLILQRAVGYIQQLKEEHASVMQKQTLDRLMAEQTVSDLTRQLETFKQSNRQLAEENAQLQAENARLRAIFEQEDRAKKKRRA